MTQRHIATAALDFFGAVGTVTGSRFLVETESARVLVDCGLFQGLRDLRRRNWDPFPVDPLSIDAVVVTHAHLDHSGYLPALVRQGFRGPIFATPHTVELAQIVLLDSAHLLEEDARYAGSHGYSRHTPPLPLYTEGDVEQTSKQMQPVPFKCDVQVAPAVSAGFHWAGHILGSASVLVTPTDVGRSVFFSGDLGRPNHPLLAPPGPPPPADVIVVESTYGDRSHPRSGDGTFAAAIRRTISRGGSVIIPAFAVDRTEIILMRLRDLRQADAIPAVPIFVDSPMALTALKVYREAIAGHSPELRPDLDPDVDVFDPGDLHESRSVEQSRSLNYPRVPCIIISASGMASGGRVVHHLAAMLPDNRNTVILTGHQAEGTRGRDLLDGAATIKIHGEYVRVRAEIVDVAEFSVHADRDEIIQWLSGAPREPDTCFIVHGETHAAIALRDRLTERLGWTAVVPRLGERVRLDRSTSP